MAKTSAIEIGLDVTLENAEQTIRDLKRVQREARKATQAVAEFARTLDEHEDAIPSLLSAFSTADLQEALSKREGVTTYELLAYGGHGSLRIVDEDGGNTHFIEGPAIVTVNID